MHRFLIVGFIKITGNGLQYDQWRNAGDITVCRYKSWCGAVAFKLPLRPTLVILLVANSVFFVQGSFPDYYSNIILFLSVFFFFFMSRFLMPLMVTCQLKVFIQKYQFIRINYSILKSAFPIWWGITSFKGYKVRRKFFA